MRQSFITPLPKTVTSPPAPNRPPVVERIAEWSARHRKTAVFGWLLLVVVIFAAGHAIGGKTVPAYDAGQSGQAEQTLNKLGVTAPAVEDVLITDRRAGPPFGRDPLMRQAAAQVAAALARLPHAATDIRSPLRTASLVAPRGRSALVTFEVPGPAADQATAVEPAQRAVAAVTAGYPSLRIAEGGDASLRRGHQHRARPGLPLAAA
jgi:RND superfamily putative drug exporter